MKRILLSLVAAGIVMASASAVNAQEWGYGWGYGWRGYVNEYAPGVSVYVGPRYYRTPVVAPIVRAPVAAVVRAPVAAVVRAPVAAAVRAPLAVAPVVGAP